MTGRSEGGFSLVPEHRPSAPGRGVPYRTTRERAVTVLPASFRLETIGRLGARPATARASSGSHQGSRGSQLADVPVPVAVSHVSVSGIRPVHRCDPVPPCLLARGSAVPIVVVAVEHVVSIGRGFVRSARPGMRPCPHGGGRGRCRASRRCTFSSNPCCDGSARRSGSRRMSVLANRLAWTHTAPRWAAPGARLYPARSHDRRLRTARRIRMTSPLHEVQRRVVGHGQG